MPLLIVWLGIGEGVKVGLVVIGVIFPVYLNLHKGIRGVDPRFAELSRACGVGRWGVIRKVILPGALPSFLVGLRFALGIAWLSLVIAETVNADKGIGYLIMQGQQYLRDRRDRHGPRDLRPARPADGGRRPAASSGARCRGARSSWHERRRQPPARTSSAASASAPCCATSTSTVEPGEMLVIVGQSGCGKSTLLRAIGGLDAGYDGRHRRRRPRRLRLPGRAAAAVGARLGERRLRRRRAGAPSGASAPSPRCATSACERARRRLAGDAVGRRGAARRAGPRAHPRPRRAAARRAVRRARRADAAAHAGARQSASGASAASRSCSSRTTSRRRSCSPTASPCSTAASSPTCSTSTCPRPRSRRDERFESLRVRILEDLGVSDIDARLSAHGDRSRLTTAEPRFGVWAPGLRDLGRPHASRRSGRRGLRPHARPAAARRGGRLRVRRCSPSTSSTRSSDALDGARDLDRRGGDRRGDRADRDHRRGQAAALPPGRAGQAGARHRRHQRRALRHQPGQRLVPAGDGAGSASTCRRTTSATRYSAEWLEVVRALWRGERGRPPRRALRDRRARAASRGPSGPAGPTVYFGGESEPARALAARAADVFFINGRPLDGHGRADRGPAPAPAHAGRRCASASPRS